VPVRSFAQVTGDSASARTAQGSAPAALVLPGLGCEIPLAEIYEDTELLDEAVA
jgi:hypothetical protein